MLLARKPVAWSAMLAALLVIVLVFALFMYTKSKHFAAQTYDMAIVADDGGREAEALRLFAEACSEGYAQACEQSHKNAAPLRKSGS